MHWPARIPAGQVSDQSCASMDIVPTVLEAVGADASQYEIDGTNLLPHVADGNDLADRPIFWEMDGQTAVRSGKWKLVLNGQLVEDTEPIAEIHLSDVENDPGETVNLADKEPEITAELKKLAEDWRAGIEKRWEADYASADYEYVAHGMV
jgi:arylsulfatase A-like enzyme